MKIHFEYKRNLKKRFNLKQFKIYYFLSFPLPPCKWCHTKIKWLGQMVIQSLYSTLSTTGKKRKKKLPTNKTI